MTRNNQKEDKDIKIIKEVFHGYYFVDYDIEGKLGSRNGVADILFANTVFMNWPIFIEAKAGKKNKQRPDQILFARLLDSYTFSPTYVDKENKLVIGKRLGSAWDLDSFLFYQYMERIFVDWRGELTSMNIVKDFNKLKKKKNKYCNIPKSLIKYIKTHF